jgi:ketosteroid isomerase-like protein
MRRSFYSMLGPVLVLLVGVLVAGAPAAAQGDAPRLTHEELVWRFYADWNAGELDAALSLLAPDARWVDPRVRRTLFAGSRRGHEGIRDGVLAAFPAHWNGFTVALDQVVRNGSQVLVSGTVTGFGRTSGRLLNAYYGAVWTINDGVASRVTTFFVPERWLATL